MPVQLQILAIVFAIYYFMLTVKLIKKDKAEIHNLNRWLFLAVILIFGAVFPFIGNIFAKLLGITTLTSLALFFLTGFLLIISLEYQIELSDLKRKQKRLTQEISISNVKIYD